MKLFKFVMLLMAMAIVSVSQAEDDINPFHPAGRIANTGNTCIIIHRDVNGVGEYKILGPNCITPPDEDWDYGADPRYPNIWYKAYFFTNSHIIFNNSVVTYPVLTGGSPLSGLPPYYIYPTVSPYTDWTPSWNPLTSTSTLTPSYIYPIHNAVTISPTGALPMSPFFGVTVPQPVPVGPIQPFIEPIYYYPTPMITPIMP